ncbi:Esterase alnB [Metarhizium brunneum]|uniref:Esterase alnB n=1 Tax=Metarhizium brunneum TaxID=500148 RepID=A0A7D5UZI6_9HYPO
MKRILALHGVGSSAEILRDQLTPVVRALSQNYEFVHLDGAVRRERGPGMAPYYNGPFYSYTTGYTPAEIRDTLDDLSDFIQDDGPFDGVIGFSQGASVAASYILDHQAQHPDKAPPFGFAIFLSSVAAFSPDDLHCLPIVQRLVQQNYEAVHHFPDKISKKLAVSDSVFAEYLATTFKMARKIGATMPDYDIAFFKHRDPQKVPRVLHPALTTHRIQLPTVHFTGKKDDLPMMEQSRLVMGLCDPAMARVHQHSGGHAAPSKKPDVDRLVEAIEWAVTESANQATFHVALRRLPTRGLL